MRRVVAAFAAALTAVLVSAQSPPGYTTSDNPFQGDYAFAHGSAIALKANVKGLLLDSLALATTEAVRAGQKVACVVRVQGRNRVDSKVTLKTILLLENAAGRGVERVELKEFKAKAARAFDEEQPVEVMGDSLNAAVRVYIFIQCTF